MSNIFSFLFPLILMILPLLYLCLSQDFINNYLPERAIARLGKGYIYDLQYSPDGKLIAVGSSIGVWLYDTQTMKEINFLAGHKDYITNVYFNPKGKTFVSQSGDGQYAPTEIKLWEVPSGELLATLTHQKFSVNYIAFTPDGKTLGVANGDFTVQLYDGFSGELMSIIKGRGYQVLAFSPDGKVLAGGNGERIRLLDVATGELKSTFAAHANNVNTIKYFPDGNKFISHGGDNNVCIWDAEIGDFLRLYRSNASNVSSIDISIDGNTLAIVSSDGSLTLWNNLTGGKIKTITSETELNYVQYAPDGKTFACIGDEDITMQLFDVDTADLLHDLKIPGHRKCVIDFRYSPDGQTLAVSDGFEIYFWDANRGELQSIIKGYSETLGGATFNPNDNTLVSFDYNVGIWDLNNYKLQKTIETKSMISSATFSPDGKKIAIGTYDNTILLWDLTLWKTIYILEGHSECVSSVEFSPDGKKLASESWDNMIKLWDVDTGKLLNTFSDFSIGVSAMRFSPDGQNIVVIGDDKIVKTWNVNSGELSNTIEMNFEGVSYSSKCFSPDGKTLITADGPCKISLWDVSNGERKNSVHFEGISDDVVYPSNDVVYSPNGKFIACAVSCLIFLWDVETGELLDTFNGHIDKINSIAFSTDGKNLVSCGRDKTVIFWDLTA